MPETMYGFFHEPGNTACPGILTLDGQHTSVALWERGNGLLTDGYMWRAPRTLIGDLSDGHRVTLWNLHEPLEKLRVEPNPTATVSVTALQPGFGAWGKCSLNLSDERHIAGIQVESNAMKACLSAGEPRGPELTDTSDWGAVKVFDGDLSGPPWTTPLIIDIEFDHPVSFWDAWLRCGSLTFLCEALTGHCHTAEGWVLRDSLGEAFRIRDFTSKIIPFHCEDLTIYHSVVKPERFPDLVREWIATDPERREARMSTHECLSWFTAYGHDRLAQAVKGLECLAGPNGKYEEKIRRRAKVVTAELPAFDNAHPLHYFGQNLEAIAAAGAEVRNRTVHGPRDNAGRPREAFVDDPDAVLIIAKALEFVLAMSDLIDCGFDFQRWVTGRHPFASDQDRDLLAGNLHNNGVGYLMSKYGGLEAFKDLMAPGST